MRSSALCLVALSLAAASCGPPSEPQIAKPVVTGSTTTPPPPPVPSDTGPAPSADPPPTPPPEPPSKWAKCEAPPSGMACIPGGNAVIGSDTAREAPRHTVEVSTFYADKREVRNKEYEQCQKAGVCPERSVANKALLGADQPAVGLTWQMAHDYCVWAGKRLLTEAEWEKVARGGEEARAYPWGADAPSCEKGQFQGCAPGATKDAGSSPAGAYGALDMAGNASEWVQDWSTECYGGCSQACGDACLGLDPPGPCSGAPECKGSTQRVVKGGSWLDAPDQARGSLRRAEAPGASAQRLGVRCASSTPQLATHPPLILSDPPSRPAEPKAPTEAELAAFRGVTEDTDVFKIPLCPKVGQSTHKCRDPWSHVTSNEIDQQLFAPYVLNLGGGYVGLGSDQGYSFIAHARSEWAWLFDYDPAVVRVHYILRAVILASPTRKDFLEALDDKASKTTAELVKRSLSDSAFPGNKPLSQDEIDATVGTFRTARESLKAVYAGAVKRNDGWHWLRSEETYGYIRLLYQQGRIVALKGNLLTTVAIPSISAAAKKMGVKVRVYYTSNADDQWPLTQEYRDGLLSLPFDERSVMVHTTVPRGRGRKLNDFDYVVHDGLDIQRRLRRPGFDRIVWLTDEGRRVAPKLVTVGLPAKTPRDEPAR